MNLTWALRAQFVKCHFWKRGLHVLNISHMPAIVKTVLSLELLWAMRVGPSPNIQFTAEAHLYKLTCHYLDTAAGHKRDSNLVM